MRKSVVQKETSKWNTTKSVSTSSDTNMGKHTVPSSSNTSAFGRKLKIQSRANSDSHTKYGSKSIEMNSALMSSQNTLKKSLPKAVNMSVGPSCTFESVKWPKTAPNSGSSRVTAIDARVSKESSYPVRWQLLQCNPEFSFKIVVSYKLCFYVYVENNHLNIQLDLSVLFKHAGTGVFTEVSANFSRMSA